MTILGMYILVSLGFVAIALVEFAIILFFKRKTEFTNDAPKDLDLTQKANKKKMRMLKSKVVASKLCNEVRKHDSQLNATLSKVDVIDMVAICVHFVAFFMFNVYYWNEYLK